MNPSKSDFGTTLPSSLARTDETSAPSHRPAILEEQKGGAEDHVVTRGHTTDWKQVVFREDSANVAATQAAPRMALLKKMILSGGRRFPPTSQLLSERLT